MTKNFNLDELLDGMRNAVLEDTLLMVEIVEEASRLKERLEYVMERYQMTLPEAVEHDSLDSKHRDAYRVKHAKNLKLCALT